MIKTFLISTIFPIFLFASQQIVLVVTDDFNTSHASLELIEHKKVLYSTTVNIGRNGLGWGIGEIKFPHKSNEPLKQEGDGKAPAGVFKLTNIFGYGYSSHFKLPYLHASKKLICVDDSNANFYNSIIEMQKKPKSFEYMRRDDMQYKYGVTVAHNPLAKKGRGSCIFLHIQKSVGSGTAGCTSMSEHDLLKIINWLDKSKNPLLIQMPKGKKELILQHYPELKVSKYL